MFRISSLISGLLALTLLSFGQYSVSPFDSLWICSDNNFSTVTDFQKLSNFSINETHKNGFKKKQANKTILIGVPSGFELNPDSGSVYTSIASDLLSLTHNTYSSYIEVSVTIPNAGGEEEIDTIFFEGFYIRALSASSGDFYRGGTASSPGTFKIHSGVDNPGDGSPSTAESLGFISASGDMSLTGITITQNETSNVAPGFINKQVIGIEVEVDGYCSNFNLTDFDFSTVGDEGTDNVANTLNDAHVYYTGTNPSYSTVNLFGTYSLPNNNFKISGNQTLSEGINYFWLAYDIDVDANTGDRIDASCTDVTFDILGKQTITNTSPAGHRLLSAYYSTSTGDWGNSDNWALDICNGDGTADGTTPDTNDAVIICTGDTITLDADITVASVIIKDGGHLIDNSLNRKLSILEELIVYGSGTITLNGTEELKVSGNATFLGTGTIDIAGSSTYEGDFDLGPGTTYNQNGTDNFSSQGEHFTLNGILNFNSNGSALLNGVSNQYVYGSGTITSNNSTTEVLLENSNKIIHSTTDITIQPKVNFNDHNYTVTNFGIVTLQYDGVSTQGDLDAQSNNNGWINSENSVLNYGGLNNIFDFKGDFYASASNNTVNFNGTGNQNIIVPTSSIYFNLHTGGSGIKTALEFLDVNGNISISESSEFSSNNYNITLAGDWNNTSIYTPGSSEITFDGSSDQNINKNSSIGETYYDFTINKEAGNINLTENSDVTIENALTLNKGLIYLNSSNLIINSTATISNYSHISFINTNSTGYLRKMWMAPGSFVFPVGDLDSLTEFSIQLFPSTIGSDAYTEINVTSAKYQEIGTTENFIDRYWDLEPYNITDPSYNFSANYLQSDVHGDENLIVSQKHHSEWKSYDSTNITTNTLSGVLATSFSKFSGFDQLVALPIELIYFSVDSYEDQCLIEWETGAELNNSHFDLLRSKDGITFNKIATIKGAGTYNNRSYYQFWDKNLIGGKYYYKLKQVDFNGNTSYSRVKAIEIENQYNFIIYPNPFTGNTLNIKLNEKLIENASVEVFDIEGRILAQQNNINSETLIQFDSITYSGTYFIRVSTENRTYLQRLTIYRKSN